MPLLTPTRLIVGTRPTIRFTFKPAPTEDPTKISTAVTVTVQRPDGTTFVVVSSPDASMTSATYQDADGIWATQWDFTFPMATDVGSERSPWRARCQSTQGILWVIETAHLVGVSGLA